MKNAKRRLADLEKNSDTPEDEADIVFSTLIDELLRFSERITYGRLLLASYFARRGTPVDVGDMLKLPSQLIEGASSSDAKQRLGFVYREIQIAIAAKVILPSPIAWIFTAWVAICAVAEFVFKIALRPASRTSEPRLTRDAAVSHFREIAARRIGESALLSPRYIESEVWVDHCAGTSTAAPAVDGDVSPQ